MRRAMPDRRPGPDRHAWALLGALVRAEQLALAGAAAHSPYDLPGTPPRRLAMVADVHAGTTTRHPRERGGAAPYDSADPQQQRVAALVTLAQRGDAEAFGQIYDCYVDSVYRYLYYRVGSHPLAEDLTSETFLRALRRIDSFSWQGKDIGAWFVTIARNLVTDHVKSSRYRLEVSAADIFDTSGAVEAAESRHGGTTEDIVLDHLRDVDLLRAVKQLKPEQQECIVLRFLQGLSVAETAGVLGRSEGAVKQLQLRAVRALAQLVPKPVD